MWVQGRRDTNVCNRDGKPIVFLVFDVEDEILSKINVNLKLPEVNRDNVG